MTSREHGNEMEKSSVAEGPVLAKPNLKGDWSNFFLLLLLYTMQNVPLGMFLAVSVTQRSHKAVYEYVDFFSLSGLLFCSSILWAPLVDALYLEKMGKRKSWLVPVQYTIGIILLYMASNMDYLIPENETPNFVMLNCIFVILNFLATTQGIVVDGWALTMLKKYNVGYASPCKTSGLDIGLMISYIIPKLFMSEDFCNKYLRITPDIGGLITLKSILYFWGIMFILITTLIGIFKKEKDYTIKNDHVKLSIVQNYVLLWDILKLPSVQILAIALLTARIGFAETENAVSHRFQDTGLSRDNIILSETTIFGVNMIVQLFVAKYTSGPKSMSVYLKSILVKLLLNIVFGVLIYYAPKLILLYEDVKMLSYCVIFLILLSIQTAQHYIMSMAPSAFFSRISDPRFGATYMVLFNTLGQFQNPWISTLTFKMINLLTFKECSTDSMNDCSTHMLRNMCTGNCIVTVDGFYVVMTLCTIIGILWYVIFRNIIKNLQSKSLSHWRVDVKKTTKENDENL